MPRGSCHLETPVQAMTANMQNRARLLVGLVVAAAAIGGILIAIANASQPGGGSCDNGAAQAALDGANTGSSDNPTCVTGNISYEAAQAACLNEGPEHYFIGTSDSSAGASNNDITVASNGKYLNITTIDHIVVWSVVKDGPNYNRYGGDYVGLHSPLNNGGAIPQISHWGVCYAQSVSIGETTTTVGRSTTTQVEETTTSQVEETTTTTEATTTTTEPETPSGPSGDLDEGSPELPRTGPSVLTMLSIIGLLTIAAGVVLLAAQQRRIQLLDES